MMGRVILQIFTTFLIGEAVNFSQLLNVHRVSDVRQMEIHTAKSSPFEAGIAVENLKI
jgi:hypothetical protein